MNALPNCKGKLLLLLSFKTSLLEPYFFCTSHWVKSKKWQEVINRTSSIYPRHSVFDIDAVILIYTYFHTFYLKKYRNKFKIINGKGDHKKDIAKGISKTKRQKKKTMQVQFERSPLAFNQVSYTGYPLVMIMVQ